MTSENQSRKNVLVVGGGIAGVTLASLLSTEKYDVTIVEKGPAWRTLGYAIGLWKVGIDILKKLPLKEGFWAEIYPMKRSHFLNHNHRVIAEIDFNKLAKGGLGALTVERNFLHGALVELLPSSVESRFNTTIQQIEDDGKKVHVTFNDGSKESFDLVVIADGMRSATRSLVFGDCLYKYPWAIWGDWTKKEHALFEGNHVASNAGVALLNVPGHDRCVTGLIFHCKKDCVIKPPKDKEEIMKNFSGLRSELQMIISDIEDPNKMFIDQLACVRMKDWYKGKVVLIGDARHGMSPISGWGTSLALEDAYELAMMLNQSVDIDQTIRSFAKRRQKILNKVKRFCRAIEASVLVENKFQILLRDTLLGLFPSSPQKLMEYATKRTN
ncbi:MAG TPA: NAD(P)/FAD-dependent oxidoreductase [Candidatus Paceibacterota bacterium]|nr:NAD(P)/FAD-dependent oxidoreductase [Candidatus Paceibacterota bacterium]